MAHNTIVLKIFKDKSNLDDFKIYICSMTEKIIDIKNKILKDIFDLNGFNYLDFENISEKVYKDYGKLFFDKGILPRTIDNYSLQDFTVESRDFSFLCIPTNICEKPKLIRNNYINSAGPRRACSDADSLDLSKVIGVTKEQMIPRGVFRKLQTPEAPHPGQALLGAAEKVKIESTYKNPNKTLQKNENKFIFNEDDFPPLK
jgi:hypothetical protein